MRKYGKDPVKSDDKTGQKLFAYAITNIKFETDGYQMTLQKCDIKREKKSF